ncbi:MAG: HAMP domain-containing sensor histidine kinase [Burkholderiales bacterium]|nr:HAMP domain-containing sensor histidine kinase [Burkholderiales bacterium]
MDHVIQIYELLIHWVLIFYCYKIYSKATQDKGIFRWLLLTNIFFLAHDSAFYFGIFRFAATGWLARTYYPVERILVNNCCFSVWLVCFSIFICSILYKYILDRQKFLQLSVGLFVFSMIIIGYYWLPTRLNTEVMGRVHSLYIISTLILEFMIFGLCLICLIYTNSRQLLLFLSGVIIMIAGDFITTYGRMVQLEEAFKYGDSIWCFGILTILWSYVTIVKSNSYQLKELISTPKNIKSQVIACVLLICVSTFIISFILAIELGVINSKYTVVFPLFIMLYSIVLAILSIKLGYAFERPFLQTKDNILALLNKDNSTVNDRFYSDEFQSLHKFIEQAFVIKDKQDLLYKTFGNTAASAVHDMVSPINALKIIIKKLNPNNHGHNDLQLFDKAIEQIQTITNNILTQYHEIDVKEFTSAIYGDITRPSYFVINTLIRQLIYNKKLEYENTNVVLSYHDGIIPIWIRASHLMMMRILSNLINNAYESNANNIQINVQMLENESNTIIEIIDNGEGIPSELIEQVKSGKSLKHKGLGLGLSSAIQYVNSLDGVVIIKSDVAVGTTVTIKLPTVILPLP